MKFGQILVQLMKNNPNSLFDKLCTLEIRSFYDFFKPVIMLIFNVNNVQIIFTCSKSAIEKM